LQQKKQGNKSLSRLNQYFFPFIETVLRSLSRKEKKVIERKKNIKEQIVNLLKSRGA